MAKIREFRWAALGVALAIGLTAGDAWGAGPSAQELSATIDAHFEKTWAAAKVRPAPRADDAAFHRRVYLDLVGRIPTSGEVRQFLYDTDPHKRQKLVDRLIDSPIYARHMAVYLRRAWVPQTDVAPHDGLRPEVEEWLSLQILNKVPLDKLAYNFLTGTLEDKGAPVARSSSLARRVSKSYLEANGYTPENLAGNTARAFLGVNLDCAQCHDHPFARWTRDQFWETAAFFAPLKSSEGMPAALTLAIPGVDRRVGPKLLTGEPLTLAEPMAPDTGRKTLATWTTSPRNPFFAKNAVNRLWAHLCGHGLVEPLDDLTASTSNVFAGLLDELATGFAATEFDLPRLAKAIVLSKPFQLGPSIDPKPRASVAEEGTPATDEVLFARAMVRPLSGEQLYDSLRTAAGWPLLREDLDGADEWGHRRRFAETFRIEVVGAPQRSILQSLAMMNGPLTTKLSRIEHSPTLEGITQAPFLSLEGKVEALLLATLGRSPRPDESTRFVAYVKSQPDEAERALADLFWVLVNSVEFNTNH